MTLDDGRPRAAPPGPALRRARPRRTSSWIADAAVPVELAAGRRAGRRGRARRRAVRDRRRGELQVVKRSRTSDVPIALLGPGEIVGEMAIFEAHRGTPRCGPSLQRGSSGSRVKWSSSLLSTRPSATLSMLRTVMGRLRSTEAHAQGTREAGGARDPVRRPGPRAEQSRGRRAAERGAAAGRPRPLGGCHGRAGTAWSTIRRAPRSSADLGEEVARHAGSRASTRPARRQRPRLGAGDIPRRARRRRRGRSSRRRSSAAGWDRGAPRAHRGGSSRAMRSARVVTWVAAGSGVHALVDEVATGAAPHLRDRQGGQGILVHGPGSGAARGRPHRAGQHARRSCARSSRQGSPSCATTSRTCRRSRRSGASSTRSGRTSWTTPSTPWTAAARSGSRAFTRDARHRRRDLRRRAGHAAGGPRPDLRALLHDQAARQRDRAGPPHLAQRHARHGGRIDVRSRPGETCFEVVLPRERRSA